MTDQAVQDRNTRGIGEALDSLNNRERERERERERNLSGQAAQTGTPDTGAIGDLSPVSPDEEAGLVGNWNGQ